MKNNQNQSEYFKKFCFQCCTENHPKIIFSHVFIFSSFSSSYWRMKTGLDQSILKEQTVKYNDEAHLFSIMVNVCWASAYSGYCLGYFNTINFDDTMEIFDLKADRALMQGSLSFCIPAGAAIGGYFAKEIISRFSRKDSFMFVGFVAILVTLLLQTKVLFLIFASRIIQGITVGVSTVLRSIYIKQFVPLELAGKFGAINQIFFALGLIFTFVITYVLSLLMEAQDYWRVIYIFPVFFSGLQIYNFTYKFPYETPKYLLEINKKEEARQLICIIYKAAYVEERMNELQKHINISMEKEDQQLMPIQNKTPLLETQQIKLTSNRLAVIVAYLTSSLQQLSGIQVIIIYTGEIMLTINPSLQKLVPLLLQIVGMLSSLYVLRLLPTNGRKDLLQFGLFTMGSMHFVVAACFLLEYMNGGAHPTASFIENVIIVIGLFASRWIFSLSIGPITWMYLPEIVQPQKMGNATMLNWILAATVSFVYPIMVELVGSPYLIFAMFGAFLFAGYQFNKKWMVETKDKPEWQVRQQYDQLLKHY